MAKTMDGKSATPDAALIEMLKTHCPEVFTEDKIDIEKLKRSLGQGISVDRERYGLNWAGKGDCFRHIQEPTTATLLPLKDESVDFDNTENIFIEGDNLQVLKVLQKSYYGKIKMIYIDPPYNTGNDSFIYSDRFQETQEEYLRRIGDKDVEGNLMTDGFFRKNSSDSGHFHSHWLTMMYPRLFLARNLLRQDGYFVVSIDDAELSNLQSIMNEVFGEENYIATLVWDRNRKNDAKFFSVGHEYMLVYAKDKQFLRDSDTILRAPKEGIEDVRVEFSRLRKKHKDEWGAIAKGLREFFRDMEEDDPRLPLARFNKVDEKGPYRDDGNINWPGGGGPTYEVLHPVTGKPCKIPRSGWRYPTKKRMDEEVEAGRVVFGVDETTVPRVRTNLFESSTQVMKSVHYSYAQTAAQVFDAIFDGVRVFDNPKHYVDLLSLVDYFTDKDDIVLDFFAGTGSTAHAVMELNVRDGGKRKFIMIQLNEPVNPDVNTGQNAIGLGLKTVSDIGKERIRRVSKQIASDLTGRREEHDLGMKVLRLGLSNFKIWRSYIDGADDLEAQMEMFVDNVNDNAVAENILYELILKSGLDLNVSVEARKANGRKYFALDGGRLIVCLEEKATQGLIDTIIQSKPEKVIFLDKAFSGNDQLKTNTALQMEAEKIDFTVI